MKIYRPCIEGVVYIPRRRHVVLDFSVVPSENETNVTTVETWQRSFHQHPRRFERCSRLHDARKLHYNTAVLRGAGSWRNADGGGVYAYNAGSANTRVTQMMMTTTVMRRMRTTTTVMARVLHGQVVWKVLSGESCGLIAVLFCTRRTQQIIRTRAAMCGAKPVEMNAASDDVCEGKIQSEWDRPQRCAPPLTD